MAINWKKLQTEVKDWAKETNLKGKLNTWAEEAEVARKNAPPPPPVWAPSGGYYNVLPSVEKYPVTDPELVMPQWEPLLRAAGFKGNISNTVTLRGGPGTGSRYEYYNKKVWAPDAKEMVDKLRAAGYDIRPKDAGDTFNYYWGIVTPKGVYEYMDKGDDGSKLLLQGALMLASGGISGAIEASLAGVVGAETAAFAAPIISSGLTSGLSAELSGGDFGEGFAKGAVSGGISNVAQPFISQAARAVSDAVGGGDLGAIAANATASGIKSGIGALTSGKDIGSAIDAIGTGAVSGAVNAGANIASQAAGSSLGAFPEPVRNAIVAGGIAKLRGVDPIKAATTALGKPSLSSLYQMPDFQGQEDFFKPGGEGFQAIEELSPEEVTRELYSLQSRYPSITNVTDLFLGEGVESGVPEWDFAAVMAGLPIGNLEQDYTVVQTATGPVIKDSAGNIGTFVDGQFVVDTGLTPDLSYQAATTTSTASAPAPAPALAPEPPPPPPPPPVRRYTQVDPQQWMKLSAVMAGKPSEEAWSPYLLGPQIATQADARESKQEDTSFDDLMSIFGEDYQI